MPKKILVTSALPYANGPIHLGHLAGAYLPADIFVRYQRLKGEDVLYICGSDEHGVPIMLRARNEGVDPQEIVDRYHEMNKKSFADFGMSFDYYGRTSSDMHHRTSQEFFNNLAHKNEFILKKEKQLYDPEAGIFLADRFVRGTCPVCDYDDAYGDQCEKCGSSLSPRELKNPRSAVTNATPVLKETTHWYLPLSKYQPDLEKWINSHPEWKSNVTGQIHSWFNAGLNDRAVTRDLPWGVEVPKEVAEKEGVDAKGKVLYVWFDAPIGYISATREWAEDQNAPDRWKEYWQDSDTRLVHFIGKDNIVFHCIIFPGMLMAHGDYVLPDNIPANEFLNLEGNKLSTSRNYAVWLNDYLKSFEADALRYVLASNLPETRDTDFSWKEFQARHNNELADILGNFVNRTFTFAHKYFDGKVPVRQSPDKFDQKMLSKLKQAPEQLGKLIDQYQFKAYIRELMDIARFGNKYFNDKEPWKTRNENPEACATTVNVCLQAIQALSVLAEPVLPFSTQKLRKMLNLSIALNWNDSATELEPGHFLGTSEILFRKIEDAEIQPEIDRLKQALAPAEEKDNQAQLIDIDTFAQTDLRVAEIIEAEKIKNSDKLLKLRVRLGQQQKQIVAGIATHYEPADLIGKKVIVVANLEPAKLRGQTSEGMLLAATGNDKLTLLTVMDDFPSGSKVS